MHTNQYLSSIQKELSQIADRISETEAETLVQHIVQAKRIYVAGAGRSGLMMRAFAMRLMHLGLDSYVVGETVTPGLSAGDMLLIGSGSGETKSLLSMAQKAKSLQATVAVVTIFPESSIGKLSSLSVSLPGSPKDQSQNTAETIQPMGSLFEQTLFLFLDAIILRLMDIRKLDSQAMYSRHANLE